jgi:anti-anti-sigma factor
MSYVICPACQLTSVSAAQRYAHEECPRCGAELPHRTTRTRGARARFGVQDVHGRRGLRRSPRRPWTGQEAFRSEVSYHGAGSWLVALFGELDVSTVPEAGAALRLARGRASTVTLDLRGLTFMDSTGIHMLVDLQTLARWTGFDLFVVRGSDAVQRLLAVSGVEEHLTMVDAPGTPYEHRYRFEYAVIATDLAGVVTHWNTEAERLYGWSAREVLARPIFELTVGPDDQQLADEIMDCVVRTGVWEGEFEVRRKDGSRFLAHVRDQLIADEDGNPVGLLGTSVESSRRASGTSS